MKKQATKKRPALFRALGNADPPETVVVAGRRYRRVSIYKHDSWAATALYRGEAGEVVCKFNRIQSILGFPARFLGRWLARRERKTLRVLAGLQGVPRESGPIYVSGRWQANAVAHEYIPGRPLGTQQVVTRDFFFHLQELLSELHRRDVAYVDFHKQENVLVGSDGRPYLIDFQVSFGCQAVSLPFPFRKRFLRELQRLDWYHLAKHVSAMQPAQLEKLGLVEHLARPKWLDFHRRIAAPLRTLRRRLLVLLRIRSRHGMVESEQFAEEAFREFRRAS